MKRFPEISGRRKCNFFKSKNVNKNIWFFLPLSLNFFFNEKIAFIFTVYIFAFGIDDKNCISHNNAWSKVDTAQKKG